MMIDNKKTKNKIEGTHDQKRRKTCTCMNNRLFVQVLVPNEEEKTQNERGKKTPPYKILLRKFITLS